MHKLRSIADNIQPAFLLNLIIDLGKIKVEKNTNQANHSLNVFMSTMAWLAVILTLLVVALGNDILTTIKPIYFDLAFPFFFVPWFLLVISSVQKLSQSDKPNRLQIWILKTTIPLFIFTIPFFSNFLSGSTISISANDISAESNTVVFGFEPYCIYAALLLLILLHFIPGKTLMNKIKI